MSAKSHYSFGKLLFAALFSVFVLLTGVANAESVNINTADANTMAKGLSGVGKSRAEAIVAYRNEHGSFQTIDDLVNVPGIGKTTLEKLRGQATVGESSASVATVGQAADSAASETAEKPN